MTPPRAAAADVIVPVRSSYPYSTAGQSDDPNLGDGDDHGDEYGDDHAVLS